MNHLAQHIESLIFVSPQPVSGLEIKTCLEEAFEQKFKQEEVDFSINEIREKYKSEVYSFEIQELAGGYQFLTKGAYQPTIGTFLKQKTKKQLSRSALETLSIIAYKQPSTKTEIEQIRGVSCDYSIQKLLEKELVDIIGRSDAPGRPLLYVTSEKFMNYFGINSIKDLPKPKDFKTADNEIGKVSEGDTAQGGTPAPQEQ